MEALFAQVATLAKRTVNEAERKKLIDDLRNLAISLEDTQESAQRILYSQIPLAVVRLGCDLKLFQILEESGTPKTVQDLSSQLHVAPKLMGRILRYMASIRLIHETSKDTFAANNVTATFANPGFQGGVYHYFDYVNPGIQLFPDFLKEHGYQDVEDTADCVLPKAWKSNLPTFLHYQTKPDLFAQFNKYMKVQRLGMPTWMDVYPYQKLIQGLTPQQPFFVDIGGGFGHQCIALREALPELPNKILLQDIAATLEHVIQPLGVDIIVQDFFQPQQTKGAKIYYMRNIIHDYPDEKAIEILQNTKAALGPDSVILIDDMVLPGEGVHWQAAQLDLTMMICLASIERTEEQWMALIPKAGLRINKIYQYTASLGDSILECILA